METVSLVAGSRSFAPVPVLGATKYGEQGLFNGEAFAHLEISNSWKEALAKTANAGLAKSSWSAYSTGIKMFYKCCNETNTRISFPINHDTTIIFVAWMLDRGLAASTMKTYLASLRQLHATNNIVSQTLRTPLVNLLLEGKKHKEVIERRMGTRERRLPMTPKVLRLLKKKVKGSSFCKEEKLLIWAISTVAFAGALRIHELLARTEATFDPCFTLLGRDVELVMTKVDGSNVGILQLKIKSEKKDRVGVDCMIDIYESGGELCPVKAYKRWTRAASFQDPDLPAFCDQEGRPFTGRRINRVLGQLLGPNLNNGRDKFTSHSFRIGLATMLGQLGYDDEDLKAMGRWSSKAFELYLRLPRTKRLAMAKKLADHNM